jgi:hypothetical protein
VADYRPQDGDGRTLDHEFDFGLVAGLRQEAAMIASIAKAAMKG